MWNLKFPSPASLPLCVLALKPSVKLGLGLWTLKKHIVYVAGFQAVKIWCFFHFQPPLGSLLGPWTLDPIVPFHNSLTK
ncbi:MAG: hypothetical protein C5B50_03040 [Verrucomicrobia bacterium]|nr:MAG: hypothetical protein C5B50_03040 [Verrucomicrobiota bacterium]